ncbi:MAG: DNA translocase FtsK 4TM domain-containing protein [Brumimicrobium sp.]
MAKGNVLKEKKVKSDGKSKTTKKGGSKLSNLYSKVDKRKAKSISGVLFLLFSIYLFIAFTSYLFTWKADQDLIINTSFFNFMFNEEGVSVSNWLGKFGAWISHFFIYKWFGIASFAFSLLFFIIGTRLLLNIRLYPLRKSLLLGIVAIVWFSVFFGLFSGKVNYLGGTFGFNTNEWLTITFGSFGAFLLVLVLLFVSVVIFFNPDFKSIINNLLSRTPEESDEKENSNSMSVADIKIVNTIDDEEINEEEDPLEVNFSEEKDKEDDSEESDEDNESTLEIHDTKNSENNDEEDDENEFSVEVAPEEKELSESDLKKKLEEFGAYDPKLDLASYTLPPIDLLQKFESTKGGVNKEELEGNKNKIVETLSHYKIEISKIKATIGPTVTLYEIVPAPGVRISKIKNLEDDIALSLAALGIRIIAPIPGKGTIGIEVPNSNPEIVSMRSLIASEKFQNSDAELPIVLGKTITNETFIFDLTKMPHLLVAGATGQGKSVGLNAILVSLLYKKHPAQIKFVLIDPKKVELTLYNKIERHFLAKLPGEEEPIITDTSKVVNTLNSLCIEMDERYDLLKMAHVRNIKEYNTKFIARKLNPEKGHRYMPYIVVLIDEFSDLIMTAGKEVEHPIARLAQLARAIGIHLIVATQRPSVNVITGMIKANFPARIAFRVLSKIDSRTILDASGADQLIGKGDMLISTGNDMIRLQCGFVDTPEVEEICDFIGNQRAYPDALLLPEYTNENDGGENASDDLDELDENFVEAARIIVIHQQGSASLLQRKLKLGYNRAGRIVDQLEAHNIIGPFKGSKAREVVIPDEAALDEYLSSKGLI